MTVVAVDALRHCPSARTAPLAALPAVFALHALTSAVVWWTLQGVVPPAFGQAAMMVFLSLAFVLLPLYLPIAILAIEPNGWRRGALVGLVGLGFYASFTYAIYLAAGVWSATAYPYSIDFDVGHPDLVTSMLYLAATCGSLLLSGDRRVAIWGCLNVAAVAIIAAMADQGLPSLWCLWAVATSVFVAWYLRGLEKRHASGEPWPWNSGPYARALP